MLSSSYLLSTHRYSLSLHDALPILPIVRSALLRLAAGWRWWAEPVLVVEPSARGAALARRLEEESRSEEHTSELQSPCNLVCRLLLEKKKIKKNSQTLKVKILTAKE